MNEPDYRQPSELKEVPTKYSSTQAESDLATIDRLRSENAALDRNFRDAVDARTRALNEAVDQRAKQEALTAEVEALRKSAERELSAARQAAINEGAINADLTRRLQVAEAELAVAQADKIADMRATLEKCFRHLIVEIERKTLNESAADGTQALSLEVAKILDEMRDV